MSLKKLSLYVLLSFIPHAMQASMTFGSSIERVSEIKLRQDRKTGHLYISIVGVCDGENMQEEFSLDNVIFKVGMGPALKIDKAGHVKAEFPLRYEGRYQILTEQQLHDILMKPQESSFLKSLFSLRVNQANSELSIDCSVIRKATKGGSSALCFEYKPEKKQALK